MQLSHLEISLPIIQMGEMNINNIRYADDTTLVDLVFDKFNYRSLPMNLRRHAANGAWRLTQQN